MKDAANDRASRDALGKMPALPSVREAMREAGVPGWEPDSGVSSAEAIRWLGKRLRDLLAAIHGDCVQRIHVVGLEMVIREAHRRLGRAEFDGDPSGR